MKLIFLISIIILSTFCFGKGGGGSGGHGSSGGHSSSHSESSSHESVSSHESIEHESVNTEHEYNSTAPRTYFVQPDGMYRAILRNNHTSNMDTIRASSKEELDNKINELSDFSLTGNQVCWILAVVCGILLTLFFKKI